jgi:hypothetical protein
MNGKSTGAAVVVLFRHYHKFFLKELCKTTDSFIHNIRASGRNLKPDPLNLKRQCYPLGSDGE